MLVVGQFLPLTVADVVRIRVQRPDEVGIIALPGDPVTLAQRVRWVQAALPGLVVRVLSPGTMFDASEEPVYALDDASAAWVRGRGRVVLLLRFDLRAPSSAEIRHNPLAHWAVLPEAVRPYFVRRVRIFGPESTGKSTLAAALADHFGTLWVPEASRALYEASGYRFSYNDVAAVAWAQLDGEEAAALRANRVLVCDTDALTTLLYARHYFGQVPPLLERLVAERTYALTFLCHPDIPWVPDPCRDSPEVRARLFEVFRAELQARAVPYVDVRGDEAERTDIGIRAMEAMLMEAGDA